MIEKTVPKKVKMAMPSLYRSWDAYLKRYCEIGGVIEAAPLCPTSHVGKPSVSFFIEPSGEVNLVGSFDKFEATKYVNAGCFFPQTSLPSSNIVDLTNSVGAKLYEKGVIGHVTVDLVSFPNAMDPQGAPLYWAVDINTEYTDFAAICNYFETLMDGKFDKARGEYNIEVQEEKEIPQVEEGKKHSTMAEVNEEMLARISLQNTHQEPRTFMFCNFLHHPGLATIQYKTFFHMCRLENVSFDVEKRFGTSFTMYDSLQSAIIGLMTIGVHRKQAIGFMIDAMNFIQNQAGAAPNSVLLDHEADSVQIHDVIATVRQINRAIESKAKAGGKETSFLN